jgi:hypothetical protein
MRDYIPFSPYFYQETDVIDVDSSVPIGTIVVDVKGHHALIDACP